ncbi:MAG: hypothetical protein ACOC9Z_09505 [Chloroflexota bacterium]
MSVQMSDLTVTDPLAEQEVAVAVRILPDNSQRPARTALVSVGTAGQPPAFASGKLEDVADLIRRAWLAYGVQAEMRPTAVEDADAGETVAEAAVGDDADGDDEDETPPAAPAQPQPATRTVQPEPQPQNLSLF